MCFSKSRIPPDRVQGPVFPSHSIIQSVRYIEGKPREIHIRQYSTVIQEPAQFTSACLPQYGGHVLSLEVMGNSMMSIV